MILPSAPRALMQVQPEPPEIAGTVIAARGVPDGAGAFALSISIADVPVAHPKAVGPYRLAVWTQWDGQSIIAATSANGAPLNGSWPDLSDGAVSVTVAAPEPPVKPGDALRLLVALVDPTGRMGRDSLHRRALKGPESQHCRFAVATCQLPSCQLAMAGWRKGPGVSLRSPVACTAMGPLLKFPAKRWCIAAAAFRQQMRLQPLHVRCLDRG